MLVQHCKGNERDYVWKEDGKLKHIIKLYTRKFLVSYNAQEIWSQRRIWRTEGKVASKASSSVGPQGHRRNIPKMQECGGGCVCVCVHVFLNPESSVNDKNRSGKVKLCLLLASANVFHAFPLEAFFAQTEMSI